MFKLYLRMIACWFSHTRLNESESESLVVSLQFFYVLCRSLGRASPSVLSLSLTHSLSLARNPSPKP